MKPGTETGAGARPPITGKGGKKEGRKWEKAVPNLRCFPNNGVVSRLFPAFPAISHLFPLDFFRGRKTPGWRLGQKRETEWAGESQRHGGTDGDGIVRTVTGFSVCKLLIFQKVSRYYAQNRPVNPRCYALLRVGAFF